MKPKDFLKELRTQEFRLRSLEEAIMVLEAKATKVTSSWSDTPSSGGVKQGMAEIVDKLIDTKKRYIVEWDKLIDNRTIAENCLWKMENTTHSTLLWLYYVRVKSWQQVAEEMSFSESYVFTMHGLALEEYSKIMEQ